jgi:hypothetical protein
MLVSNISNIVQDIVAEKKFSFVMTTTQNVEE